jgi:hypothetical protein
MTMKELYDTVRQAQESKEAKYQELKTKEDEHRRGQFKEVQKEFVEYITSLAEKRVTEVSQDPQYLKQFVDVFTFSLPPKRQDNQHVEFKGHLLIELMEGSEDTGYEEYFKSLDTVPTIDLLREAFAPLNIIYGYYRRFGNVLQVRWDKNEPKWALSQPQQFEEKKAASRRNKSTVNNIGRRWQNQQHQQQHQQHQQPQQHYMKNPFQLVHEMNTGQQQHNRNRYNNTRRPNNIRNSTFEHQNRPTFEHQDRPTFERQDKPTIERLRRRFNRNYSRNPRRDNEQSNEQSSETQTQTQTQTELETQTTYDEVET